MNIKNKCNTFKFKFPAAIFLIVAFVALLHIFPKDTYSADEIKTVQYFVGQETAETASGNTVNMAFTFFVGDTVTSTQNAVFEITGTSAASGSQVIDVSVDDSTFSTSRVQRYTLDTTGRANEFKILYDATSYINIIIKGEYSYTLNVKATGEKVSLWSAKLLLTYRYTKYSSEGSTSCCIKTVKYFVGQDTGETASATQVNMAHTFFIGDNVSVEQSVFYEINGVSASAASQVIDLSLSGGNGACAASYTLDTTSQYNTFRILYDVTSCIDIPAGQSDNSRTLQVKATGASVFIWSAELVVTYQFTPVSSAGGFRAKAEITSSTFDTSVTSGAAPNSIMYKAQGGTIPAGTKVRFQFASSSSVSGPWTYKGPDDTSTTWYEPSGPDVAVEIKKEHHNLRYLRYKIQLCSNTDCTTAGGASTPEVIDVILNWSP